MSEELFLAELDHVLENMAFEKEFTITELCRVLATSRTSLHRKVTQVTNKSISIYIREFRLQKAFEKLQNHSNTVSNVAYDVGFSDLAYFSKCFKAHYGITPSKLLEKSAKELK